MDIKNNYIEERKGLFDWLVKVIPQNLSSTIVIDNINYVQHDNAYFIYSICNGEEMILAKYTNEKDVTEKMYIIECLLLFGGDKTVTL